MNIVGTWLRRYTAKSKISRTAADVAKACESSVQRKLINAGPFPSTAESRGFIRARTTLIVKKHVEAIEEYSDRPDLRERLTRATVELIVDQRAVGLVARVSLPLQRAA